MFLDVVLEVAVGRWVDSVESVLALMATGAPAGTTPGLGTVKAVETEAPKRTVRAKWRKRRECITKKVRSGMGFLMCRNLRSRMVLTSES